MKTIVKIPQQVYVKMAALFLKTLLSVSEKAASIARVIRSDQRLFQMLIEEKTGEDKNKRFFRDFKTLADVLIQETIKHDISKEFPEIMDRVKGEENNTFTNTFGESITVEVKETERDTSELLSKVLDGDQIAAGVLANIVHSSVELNILSDEDVENLSKIEISFDKIGIWIDPIDGTSEYIHGCHNANTIDGIYPCGLQCCTVLIGVFDSDSGQPILGVINQPFFTWDSSCKKWNGKAYWGLKFDESHLSSVDSSYINDGRPLTVVVSINESDKLKTSLTKLGYNVIHGAGAGYKLLCVILHLADIYLLTQASTFKWDTCAPHSILESLGGGVVEFEALVSSGKTNSILYHAGISNSSASKAWSNSGGLVAYRNKEILLKFLQNLQKIKVP